MVRWLRWHCPPDTGFEIRALAVWGRARYLSVTEAPHNTDFHTWMGKNIFCFFQTAETGNRTPNSGVKGSGANHYPRAPAHLPAQATREKFATRGIDKKPSLPTAAPDFVLHGTSISKLHHFHMIRTIHLSLMPLKKNGKEVMSTSPSLPYHANCLYVPNAAAEETVGLCLPANVLLKAKIIKKSVILFWHLNMTIWGKHVHRLELQKFFNFCAAHLSVRLDNRDEIPVFLIFDRLVHN